MYELNNGIKIGLKNILCPNCNNQLSVIWGGIFGEKISKVNNSGIKYISGCCFENEDFYCDKCKKYYDRKLNECN